MRFQMQVDRHMKEIYTYHHYMVYIKVDNMVIGFPKALVNLFIWSHNLLFYQESFKKFEISNNNVFFYQESFKKLEILNKVGKYFLGHVTCLGIFWGSQFSHRYSNNIFLSFLEFSCLIFSGNKLYRYMDL